MRSNGPFRFSLHISWDVEFAIFFKCFKKVKPHLITKMYDRASQRQNPNCPGVLIWLECCWLVL